MSKSVVTPEFRVSYPCVFKPQVNKLNGKTEYGIVALFPKGANLKAIEELLMAAVVEKWGTDKTKWPKNLRTPIRDQGEKEKDVEGKLVMPLGHEKGAKFVNLKSKQKPGVVDQNVQPILDETQFYGGCYARASVRAYAYDVNGNRGVALGLGNIQKTKDGDPFGGRASAEEDFAPVVDSSEGQSAQSLFS